MTDSQDQAFRQVQDKGLINIENGITELKRLGEQIARIQEFINLIHLHHHLVPVFDSQYVQHQDRPAITIENTKLYLYWDKIREQRN